jgi:putative tricarboxylic transport membrane protein
VDIVLLAFFGITGYVLRKFHFEMAPLVLALVLGDKIEMSFRRALTTSEGSLWIFFKSSFSKVFLIAAVLILALQLIAWLAGFRTQEKEKSP